MLSNLGRKLQMWILEVRNKRGSMKYLSRNGFLIVQNS